MVKGTFLAGHKSQEDRAGAAGGGRAGDAPMSFCNCSRRLITSPHAPFTRGFGKKEKKKKTPPGAENIITRT